MDNYAHLTFCALNSCNWTYVLCIYETKCCSVLPTSMYIMKFVNYEKVLYTSCKYHFCYHFVYHDFIFIVSSKIFQLANLKKCYSLFIVTFSNILYCAQLLSVVAVTMWLLSFTYTFYSLCPCPLLSFV